MKIYYGGKEEYREFDLKPIAIFQARVVAWIRVIAVEVANSHWIQGIFERHSPRVF